MKRFLVLCLGNEVLSDDAFGPIIADRLRLLEREDDDVEIIYAPSAGLSLLELLEDRVAVLIVDTIITNAAPPGTLHHFSIGAQAPTRGLINSHEVNLPTALELGRQLGYAMPEDIQVVAVEAMDVLTLSQKLTPPVTAVIEQTTAYIREWIKGVGTGLPVPQSPTIVPRHT